MIRKGDELGQCAICGRLMIAGPSVDKHHFVPKSQGGKEKDVQYIHRVCHKKLHTVFSEKELARTYNTPAVILENPEIKVFVKWVRKKHPEYNTRVRKKRQ